MQIINSRLQANNGLKDKIAQLQIQSVISSIGDELQKSSHWPADLAVARDVKGVFVAEDANRLFFQSLVLLGLASF